MTWIYSELALVALAAMLSPTTLSFSVLALVLGDRPLRTGFFFYLGALTATLGIGVLAALVLGDAAASSDPSSPKTWVAVFDIVAGALLLLYALSLRRRPNDPAKTQAMIDRMGKLATSPAMAIVGAGAALANPGGFIPLALKALSETDPSTTAYIVGWIAFTIVSLLPLAVALLLLVVAPSWTMPTLQAVQRWFQRNLKTVAVALLVVLAAVLLRNGIAGLT
jgi:hypothetical protein